MNRNNLWRFVLVVLVLVWSLYEIYPPTARDLVQVFRKRVDRLGVAEPLIQPQGSDRILVQLPGLSAADQEDAVNTIKKPAFLEFRLVHPQSKELIEQGVPEPGYEILKRKERQPD